MEPMTLGSPVSNPSSPSASTAFLPPFLMGETSNNPHPSSPTKAPRQVNISAMPGTPRSILNSISPATDRRTARTHEMKPENTKTTYRIEKQSNSIITKERTVHVNVVDKPGGPPIKGLFDTLETVTMPTATPTNSEFSSADQIFAQHMTPAPTMLDNTGPPAAAPVTDNWVTVFGFPPSFASTILNQFSQLGQLLEHKFPPKGNWVHLRYYSKMEARRALTYNGKILGSTIMIGVVPCRDPNLIKENDFMSPSPARICPPNQITSPSANVNSPWTPNASLLQSPRGARRLNRSCHIDNEVLSNHNTPIKNTGIVSRTIDYFFGW